MNEILAAILGIFGIFGAWKVRGWFSDRIIRDLGEERDNAEVRARQGEIKAEAKDIEAHAVKEQQKKEAERHEKDSGSIARELDDMFR